MSLPRTTHSIAKDLDAIVPNELPAEASGAAPQKIAERLVESLRPVTPLPGRAILVGAFMAIFATVTALLFAFVGTRGAESMTVLQLAGVLAAILAAAGLASFSLSGEMTPGQRRFVRPSTMTAGILFILFALISGLFPWAEGTLQGWHCFLSGFACSIPAVVLVLWVVRKGAPLAYGTVGAAAGLLGGLVGMAAIHVGCSLLSAPHMAAGHLTIPLAGAVAGYLAGRALPYLLPRRHESLTI
jgi:hypothetical protein